MTTIEPANQLLYCCYPVINHLQLFFDDNSYPITDCNYRAIFQEDFAELERRAMTLRIDYTLMQQVKYVMVALVDEVIMHSSWDGKAAWLGQPLQLYYFSEHLAGEGFFTRLDILRQNSIIHCDLLEVYYICLQLGFAGIYHIRGREFLESLQTGLYQQIEHARTHQPTDDIKQPSRSNTEINITHFEMPFWLMGVAMLLCLVIIYASYNHAINCQAEHDLRILDQYAALDND